MCGRARCSLAREQAAQAAGVAPDEFVDGDKCAFPRHSASYIGRELEEEQGSDSVGCRLAGGEHGSGPLHARRDRRARWYRTER
jgi:hypothetical protein